MGGSYPSAEKQSVYSTAQADWATSSKAFRSYYIYILYIYMCVCVCVCVCVCYSSNWSHKIIDTSLVLMKMYIFICARVQRKTKLTFSNVKTETKTNAPVNVPKKETHHKSDDLNRINSREFTCLPLFALPVTHKEKTSVSHAGQFEKDWIRASWCSGRKFLSHLLPQKRPVREAKFNLKNYTG